MVKNDGKRTSCAVGFQHSKLSVYLRITSESGWVSFGLVSLKVLDGDRKKKKKLQRNAEVFDTRTHVVFRVPRFPRFPLTRVLSVRKCFLPPFRPLLIKTYDPINTSVYLHTFPFNFIKDSNEVLQWLHKFLLVITDNRLQSEYFNPVSTIKTTSSSTTTMIINCKQMTYNKVFTTI